MLPSQMLAGLRQAFDSAQSAFVNSSVDRGAVAAPRSRRVGTQLFAPAGESW